MPHSDLSRFLTAPHQLKPRMQYLSNNLDVSNVCVILAAACQFQDMALLRTATRFLMQKLAAATCPSGLVSDFYQLDAHVLQSAISASAILTVCIRRIMQRKLVSHILCLTSKY